MTYGEVRLLKRGDAVETRIDGKMVRVEYVYHYGPDHPTWPGLAFLRRPGRDRAGREFPMIRRGYEDLRPSPESLDPAPANVYADWLEDHGEYKAAAMLRKAFPLSKEGE